MRKNMPLPRKFFGRREELVSPPNLLFLPKESFETFLQFYTPPTSREQKGLEYVFSTSFPFKDPDEKINLEYLGYEVEGQVALVTVRRSQALNALNQDVLVELAE
ncbi:MAG: hypothetical protein ACK42C_05015, partial [Aquificaceae bacterium]